MKVWGVTEQDVRDACAQVGVKVHGEWPNYGGAGIVKDGRALRFRLGLDTSRRLDSGALPYQRVSTHVEQNGRPRRVAAVCWHGHRDMMRALFERNPDARIKTALADYRGAQDFEYAFSRTYGNGNGWNVSYGQACTCADEVRERWEA